MTASSPTIIAGIDGLRSWVGSEIGVSDWYDLKQCDLDAYAAASGYVRSIDVDASPAPACPLGRQGAASLFALSLGPQLTTKIIRLKDVPLSLNYGYDRVRFTTPATVGSRVRLRLRLDAVRERITDVTCTFKQTFERDGYESPICVAEWLLRLELTN